MCRAAEASAQPDAAKFSYAAKAKQKPGQKPFSASPAMPMSNSESRHQAAESEPASPQKPIPDHITVAAQHGPAAHVPWPMPGAVPQSPSGNETWEVSTAQSTLPPHQRAASRTSMHQVHSTDYLLSESWSCKMTLSGWFSTIEIFYIADTQMSIMQSCWRRIAIGILPRQLQVC